MQITLSVHASDTFKKVFQVLTYLLSNIIQSCETNVAHSSTTTGVSVAQWLGRRTSDPAVMGSIPRYQAPRSTQPSIPSGYVNRVPAFTGWG